MSLSWQALKPGDTIRIIAPGSKTQSSWEDLQSSCDFLRSLKLNPVFSKKIFTDGKEPVSGFYNFANSDEKRYEDFVDAFESDAQAVWCFRGGYGSDRVLTQILKNNFKPQGAPKLFLGFSDITNFHSYINARWDWSTLHAASMYQLGQNKIQIEDVEFTRDIVFGNINEINLTLVPLNAPAREARTVHGQISGGNLTVLQAALCTGWQMETKDKIVLFEDWGEMPYRVARMLQQFSASDQFAEAQAVIFGDFFSTKITGDDETIAAAMDAALQEFAESCALPVLRYTGIGHGSKNFPLPLATQTRLNCGMLPVLTAATGAAI
jgi:muramoyltetrapeptide carboxypeptidase